jgi:hypothetical protein
MIYIANFSCNVIQDREKISRFVMNTIINDIYMKKKIILEKKKSANINETHAHVSYIIIVYHTIAFL